MQITEKILTEGLKGAYKRYTGREFPYDTEVKFDFNMNSFASVECLGNDLEFGKSLMKINKFNVVRGNEIFFTSEHIPLSKKREVLMHELAHILRIEELNYIVNVNDVNSHDERWKKIMVGLGIKNPTPMTKL